MGSAVKRSEADIARLVVHELQTQGFETYEEVVHRGSRADVVAVRGPVTMIVEVKAAMSIRLLDQLMVWRGAAHLIVAAVGSHRMGAAVHRLLHLEGFGVWMVGYDEIHEKVKPRLHRAASGEMRRRLVNDQRSGVSAQAGTNGGGYWTPFAATARDLRRFVASHPGISLREALGQVSHHYSSSKSAMGALPGLLRKGVITGVRLDDTGSRLLLYPVKSAPAVPQHAPARGEDGQGPRDADTTGTGGDPCL